MRSDMDKSYKPEIYGKIIRGKCTMNERINSDIESILKKYK